jgi:hypothetical protein
MPDLDQIKQGEQGARDRRGRFAEGLSGNPVGATAAALQPGDAGCRDVARWRATALTRKPV